MGAKVNLTYKQRMQIVSFFEDSHRSIVYPDNIENSAVIALFRVCRDYCRNMSGCDRFTGAPSEEKKEAIRAEMMDSLNKLSIRYYEKI